MIKLYLFAYYIQRTHDTLRPKWHFSAECQDAQCNDDEEHHAIMTNVIMSDNTSLEETQES